MREICGVQFCWEYLENQWDKLFKDCISFMNAADDRI